MLEHRGGVACLRVDRLQRMVGRHRQPRLALGKAGVRRRLLPHHRRAAAVAALEFRPEADAVGILQILEAKLGLVEAELLALVDADRSAQRHQQRRDHLEIGLLVRLALAPAGGVAHHVMVGQRPARPAVAGHLAEGFENRADLAGRQLFGSEEVEGIAHLDAVAAGRVGGDDLQPALRVADLADRGDRRIFVEQAAEAAQELEVLRPALVVEMILEVVRVDRRRDRIVALAFRQRRIVLEPGRMEIEVDRVEAEAVDAALQPEADGLEQRVLHGAVVEIEVRLLGEEIVQVVLAAARVPLPGRAAEDRQPVVGRRAVRLGVGPDVPVGLGIVAARTAFPEPGMLVGGVRDDRIDHHAQPEPVRLVDQRVEIGERAEHRIDVAIVGDVVAEILHRRLEEGRDPDRVGAERRRCAASRRMMPLRSPMPSPFEVLEAARIDLVDHRAAPPVAVRLERRRDRCVLLRLRMAACMIVSRP